MRSFIVAAAWLCGASLCGCASTDSTAPSLIITPAGASGTVQINGPTEFSAQLVNSTAEVAWTVTGGTVTPDRGLHVTFTPPPGTTTGSIMATAGGLSASVQIAASPAVLGDVKIPGLTGPVKVVYDAQDIPHIQCSKAIDCIRVQGYVQAHDRLFPMDFLRHVARGHLAELIGIDGVSQDVSLRTIFTTRGGNRLEDELAAALDEQTRALLTGYADGVNAYLAELRSTSAALPGEYRQLPFPLTPADLDDWTVQDTLAIGRLNQFQLSETLNSELANFQFKQVYGPGGKHPDAGRMAAYLRAASPTTERGHTLSATASHAAMTGPARRRGPAIDMSKWAGAVNALAERTAVLHDRLRPADASIGSNNWVVAASKSTAHVAMVANDPHLSLQYPPLFHLSTMTSSDASENLNLAGGSFPGVPGALVGRGAHVGWGVTVVGYDVTDVYAEQFVACQSPAGCVQFNSAAAPLLPKPQSWKVRIGPGHAASSFAEAATLLPANKAPPAAILIVPHHGPIVQAPDPITHIGLSVRWTGHEGNTQDTKAIYGLNTAANVDAAIEALKGFATGAQNFVLADDAGNIAYDPHALVPVRKFAVKGSPALPWLPLPGDGTTEWGPGGGVDCAAPAGVPAACWIDNDTLPHGTNPAKGYFFTANADPLGVSDDNEPLQDLAVPTDPPYMSFDWDDSSGFRATRIEQLLEAAIAKGGVSPQDMEAIQADHVSRPGMAFTPIIAAIPDAAGPAEFAAAKKILAAWAASGWDCPSGLTGVDPATSAVDTTTGVVAKSSGCFLFHAVLRTLVTNVFTDDLALAGQRVNALAAIKALLFMLALDPNDAGTPAATRFCNDTSATGVETTKSCAAQVVTAVVQAYITLNTLVGHDPNNWIWGRVHTMKPVSLLALVTNGYSPGPFARPGGAFTVDVGSPSLTGGGIDFSFGSSGNVRHISVMDPVAKIRMQLPGPERDVPVVTTGPGLLTQWASNTYFNYAFGDQANAVAISIQNFKAP